MAVKISVLAVLNLRYTWLYKWRLYVGSWINEFGILEGPVLMRIVIFEAMLRSPREEW